MAAPHVTGAWAALRGLAGAQSVTTILNALTSTGTPVLDTRGAQPVSTPRINLVPAAEQLTGAPLAPSNLRLCVNIPPNISCPIGATWLQWDDNSSSETRFEFESTMAVIGQNPFTGPWSTASVTPNSTLYQASTPTSGAIYYFRVRACNAGGCSAYSNTLMYTAP